MTYSSQRVKTTLRITYVEVRMWYVPLCIMQCVAVCCSVLQCVAVCCSVLQCVFPLWIMNPRIFSSIIQKTCVAVCVVVCCSVQSRTAGSWLSWLEYMIRTMNPRIFRSIIQKIEQANDLYSKHTQVSSTGPTRTHATNKIERWL